MRFIFGFCLAFVFAGCGELGAPQPVSTPEEELFGETTSALCVSHGCVTDCGSHPDISCSTGSACTAVRRNCAAGQQGYVDCDGTRTYCPSCSTCQPRTTCQTGECGWVSDGCSGTIWCGTPGSCGPYDCGTVWGGCNGWMYCGECGCNIQCPWGECNNTCACCSSNAECGAGGMCNMY